MYLRILCIELFMKQVSHCKVILSRQNYLCKLTQTTKYFLNNYNNYGVLICRNIIYDPNIMISIREDSNANLKQNENVQSTQLSPDLSKLNANCDITIDLTKDEIFKSVSDCKTNLSKSTNDLTTIVISSDEEQPSLKKCKLLNQFKLNKEFVNTKTKDTHIDNKKELNQISDDINYLVAEELKNVNLNKNRSDIKTSSLRKNKKHKLHKKLKYSSYQNLVPVKIQKNIDLSLPDNEIYEKVLNSDILKTVSEKKFGTLKKSFLSKKVKKKKLTRSLSADFKFTSTKTSESCNCDFNKFKPKSKKKSKSSTSTQKPTLFPKTPVSSYQFTSELNSKTLSQSDKKFLSKIKQTMMDNNSFQLQRTFSDNVLQTNSCLSTNLYWDPTIAYEPMCYEPVRYPPDLTPRKRNRKINKRPERSLSSNDIGVAAQNYIENVQREVDRLKNFRQWEDTNFGKSFSNQTTSTGFIFTLVSYNVLAQILLSEHMYLYKKHDPRALFWEHRKWALMREFEEYNADILCLQEVEKTHLDSFYSQLNNLGYKGIFKQRTGKRIDGCALYYKDSIFNLEEYTTVEYYQPDIEILNRENVAIIARFSLKENPAHHFVVATTHLLYNPKRQDIRLAQTQLLLAEVERIAFDTVNEYNEPIYKPIIITGDFNLEPYTPVYNLLINGELVYANLTKRQLKSPSGLFRNEATMGNFLLPSYLRITDHCQHADIVFRRTKGSEKLSREMELDLIKLEHSERNKVIDKTNADNLTESKHLFSTGRLTHGLNLKSVYEHEIRNNREATTKQGHWITVDYIFYSAKNDSSGRKKTDGRLKLLSRLRIPTTRECEQLPNIPNLVFGSDHLALAAKFLLEYD